MGLSLIARVALVAVGGALGSCLRYAAYFLISSDVLGFRFPMATLSVNVAGSFIIGFVNTVFLECWSPRDSREAVRLFLATGMMGGFTTYSAFSYEVVAMVRDGKTVTALAYIAATTTVCVLVCFAGVRLASALFARAG